MTTRYTPRESFWRGHWAAIDGSAIATENDDADAFARGAERGAAALAEALRDLLTDEWLAVRTSQWGADLAAARAAGAAEERARIVAMMRSDANRWDYDLAKTALRALADRIERGEP